MSQTGTWCDNIIIQAVANALSCTIHITDSSPNANATIVNPISLHQKQKIVFSWVARPNSNWRNAWAWPIMRVYIINQAGKWGVFSNPSQSLFVSRFLPTNKSRVMCPKFRSITVIGCLQERNVVLEWADACGEKPWHKEQLRGRLDIQGIALICLTMLKSLHQFKIKIS